MDTIGETKRRWIGEMGENRRRREERRREEKRREERRGEEREERRRKERREKIAFTPTTGPKSPNQSVLLVRILIK